MKIHPAHNVVSSGRYHHISVEAKQASLLFLADCFCSNIRLTRVLQIEYGQLKGGGCTLLQILIIS